MQLINNELIYDAEDTPKAIQFGYEWNGAALSIKATSLKITSVEQRGIYNNEPRRFALVVSEALTEGEVTSVLANQALPVDIPITSWLEPSAVNVLQTTICFEAWLLMKYKSQV